MQRASSSCFPIRPANLSRIYKDYIIDHVDAKRAINVKPEKRGEIQEVLVRNYELD